MLPQLGGCHYAPPLLQNTSRPESSCCLRRHTGGAGGCRRACHSCCHVGDSSNATHWLAVETPLLQLAYTAVHPYMHLFTSCLPRHCSIHEMTVACLDSLAWQKQSPTPGASCQTTAASQRSHSSRAACTYDDTVVNRITRPALGHIRGIRAEPVDAWRHQAVMMLLGFLHL
jgi:hypothetical protein